MENGYFELHEGTQSFSLKVVDSCIYSKAGSEMGRFSLVSIDVLALGSSLGSIESFDFIFSLLSTWCVFSFLF